MSGSGKDRKHAIDYIFKLLLDILIPTHVKYLLWASSEGDS